MLPHSTSRSDPSQPLSSASEGLFHGPADGDFECAPDFADLAARFAAPSGGGLSPELSADLALEIVLNQIVEQACLATGADGAAIVLQRDGEMVCRASSGSTAPTLGSRLDTSSGLSGECLRTLHTQRCGDVLTDPRANIEASERLGVRSVMVMPLLRQEELLGFIELFSSRPFAFGDRDERTLEALASRVLANLNRALQPLPSAGTSSLGDAEIVADHGKNDSERRSDLATLVLTVAVLFCAILLGVVVGRHLGWGKVLVRTHGDVPLSTAGTKGATSARTSDNPPDKIGSVRESARLRASTKPGAKDSVPAGSLLVFENGKEIFRLPPAPEGSVANADQQLGVRRASSLSPEKNESTKGAVSSSAGAATVLYRVEPEYPDEARQQGIQGQVILEVRTGPEGAVEDIQLVSGPPQLAEPAIAAVLQWRFQPRTQNGQPVGVQSRITLNFRLPAGGKKTGS
jgi:TonB family protein